VPTPETGGWEWGEPTDVDGPDAHSGTNVWGTVLTGDYPNSVCWTLDLDLDLVVQTPNAAVECWLWYWTEQSFDGCHFKVSVDDGATWELVTPVEGYPQPSVFSNNCIGANTPSWAGNSQGWRHVVLPIGEYQGETPKFRFVFGTDGSVVYPGVFIDDLRIWGLHPPFPIGTLTGPFAPSPITPAGECRGRRGQPDHADSTVTNALGQYTIEGLRIGTYAVQFRRPTFCDSVVANIAITENEPPI